MAEPIYNLPTEQPKSYFTKNVNTFTFNNDTKMKVSIGFSLISTVTYIVLSFVMLAQKNKSIDIESKLNAPLNVDTVNYNAVLSTRITSLTKYSLWPFLVLPWITISLLIIRLNQLSKENDALSAISNKYDRLLVLLKQYWPLVTIIAANAVAWIIFTPLFVELRKNNKVADAKIQNFDNFVCSKLTRESAINILLSKKADPKDRNQLIKDIVANKLPNDTEGDAKVFYTIHLYQYFHKLGMNHVHLPAALALLKNSSRLTKCNPSKYFTRYSTNIQDLTEKLRDILRENDNLDNSTLAALELCRKWVKQTMVMANDLKSDNITNLFGRIINTNAFILPFIVFVAYLAQFIILYVYNKKKE